MGLLSYGEVGLTAEADCDGQHRIGGRGSLGAKLGSGRFYLRIPNL
jgi:hypothetical protein